MKLPSTGKEGQNQSPLAGLALISGLFLFLKNRKRNKENS
ncbi:LPXTG cell wall anchor domain-containing protein [Staphylococcus haemolyticus]|nr:LPXTG cell wall anchor domain-containing protein [Staphylococcus haemolyticus]MDU0489687.1 LPXTG cell wall anchor domain-containing protein [Staphylococcus haemolyticus]